jgi:hypothetical protein
MTSERGDRFPHQEPWCFQDFGFIPELSNSKRRFYPATQLARIGLGGAF